MDPLRPMDILDGIADAQAVWTFHRGELREADRLADLAEHADGLIRALSRLQVLAATHPELTMGDAIPRGAVSADEIEQRRADSAFVRSIVTTAPVVPHVTILVEVPSVASEQTAHVLRALNRRKEPVSSYVGPDGLPTPLIDLSGVARDALLELAQDNAGEDWPHGDAPEAAQDEEYLSEAAQKLRRRMFGRG
ncbi:hypothetical protein [Cellulomonas cellasea]|uniref:Uncharacterized protein n=1 Tax=Cellulomonas cellasea TaxID=43670 RepID=A0A7W4UHT8_9CELL|nr:hypothetical protein [Cellulomonas cellasea]MBB2924109.1 hypothetical protein [Cellulomonas cellasea]